jgi:hypothetical protein
MAGMEQACQKHCCKLVEAQLSKGSSPPNIVPGGGAWRGKVSESVYALLLESTLRVALQFGSFHAADVGAGIDQRQRPDRKILQLSYGARLWI